VTNFFPNFSFLKIGKLLLNSKYSHFFLNRILAKFRTEKKRCVGGVRRGNEEDEEGVRMDENIANGLIMAHG